VCPGCAPASLDEQAAASGSSAAAAVHCAIAGRSHCGLCHHREWRLRAVWPPDKQGGGRPEQRRYGEIAEKLFQGMAPRTPASRSSGHGAARRG
jgi:hypothetical protein